METTNRLVDADYVMGALGVSRATAYRIIRDLNAELSERGMRTLSGKVNQRYFEQSFFGMPKEEGGR